MRGRISQQMRNHAAAETNHLTSSWTTTPVSADQVIFRNLRILRARSREQYQNNDYSRRFIQLLKSNVVGPRGVVLQGRAKDRNGTLDTVANDALEHAWAAFSKPRAFDVEQRLSMVAALGLYVATVATDGECFVRMVPGGPWGVQALFIDAERVPVTYNVKLKSGNLVVAGIEYDGVGRAVAYHVAEPSEVPGSYYYGGGNYTRIPAAEMIHGFIAEQVGQRRGLPWGSTSLLRLNMLGGYEDAALTAARVGAAKMGFFTSPTGDSYTGEGEDSDGVTLMDAQPGGFEQLPEGVEFTPFDPRYPTGEFAGFVKATLRGISSGLGVSYNTLANDLEGVNYSSIRFGTIEDRELWKSLQNWLIESFLERVFEAWLPRALLAGIPIPGTTSAKLRPEHIDKYRDVVFQPRRWSWIDPAKELQAHEKAIALRLRSRSSVIREMGEDPDNVFTEIQREEERLRSLGLLEEPASPAGFFSPDENNEPEEEDADETDGEDETD